jgi:putative colanic acid biosysnthesis UDP-glucose lipid carrier transferase
MKIYPQEFPLTLPQAGGQWALTRSLIDPLIIGCTYLLIFALVGENHWEDGFIVVLLAFVLSYPGKLPFHRFSAGHVLDIGLNWTLVVLFLLAIEVAKWYVEGSATFKLHHAILIWAATVPLVLIAVHRISPAIAPYLSGLYKQRSVAIVGLNQVARRFAELINNGDVEGQRIIGYFDDRCADRLGDAGVHALGTIDQVAAYVKQHGIDIIYISLPLTPQPRILALLQQLRDTTASIWFIPDIFAADLIQGQVEVVCGVPIVSICDTPFHGTAGYLKRIMDVILVLAALPLFAPLMVAIAIAVRATSPGPVLFKQRRYGLDGKPFVVWKFRTMTTLEDGDKTYRQVTRDDDRVTPIGRFLRKTSMDELPQLLHVLGGTMSLVGPRPHALAVNEQYRKLIPGYMVRHKVKPGITGWAQVNGCRGGDDLDSMRKRTGYDLAYLRSWSLTLDLVILARTVKMLALGDRNAY